MDQLISRAGVSCEIHREVSSGTDRYGKPVTSWQPVGSVTIADLGDGRDSSLSSTEMGRYRDDEFLVAFSLSADIQSDDRVIFYGDTYRVDTRKRFPTHYESVIRRVEE
ncbi:hypothetical protein [Halobellus limi]|uniref:hypothetical protein n=1 Tax=Halobellus limi TaxID=699433 RepID=UPI0010A3EF9D|nr:hypothetical protein [Halobellus limi]